MREALLYDRLDRGRVRCRLCAHRCLIAPDERGICQVRENRAGTLHSLVYGRLIAHHVDPIEKKPLFHLAPGSLSFSIATVGCNFRCRFCQNADIAQMPVDQAGRIAGREVRPEAIVAAAVQAGCRSIAYTYTEPTVFFEFARDTARLAHERGIHNVFVTNGYMTAEALDLIAPCLDAANVDLKAFSDGFYKSACGARLAPVLETLERMTARGILVEVTTLLIPGLNDAEAELTALARFLVERLGPQTPWHISRFHPTYRLRDRSATPLESIVRARDIGLAAGLQYVYTGNVPGQEGEHTACPACGRVVIRRRGFRIEGNELIDGHCPHCNSPVYGRAW